MPLYKEHFIWTRQDESTAIRYSCFECLKTMEFFIQSVDYFRLPITDQQLSYFERQRIELFIEDDILSRNTDRNGEKISYKSLTELVENWSKDSMERF